MKKIIIILVVIVLFVVAYKNYKYFEHSLVVGNPVFNKNINESKKNKMFMFSFSVLEKNDTIFDEIWIEKKAVFSKNGIEYKKRNMLMWSYKNIKVAEKFSNGFINNTCIITDNNSQKDLIEKDTLRISILYNNKRINKTFLRM